MSKIWSASIFGKHATHPDYQRRMWSKSFNRSIGFGISLGLRCRISSRLRSFLLEQGWDIFGSIQPTNEDIFPSFLVESKSEAKCGTLDGAKGQLASAGAHRVNSWIHTLRSVESELSSFECRRHRFSRSLSVRD